MNGYLYLSGDKVTGGGFDNFVKLTKLHKLHLATTPVKDECLQMLGVLKSLKELNLVGTKVGRESVSNPP